MDFTLQNLFVVVGLFIGGMMPFLFAAFAKEGRQGGRPGGRGGAAAVPGEARDHGGGTPDYARCVRIVTASAQRGDVHPAAIPILFPIVTAFIFGINNGREMLGGLLLGTIVTGISATMTGGGAWDNAKKLIEDGHLGGRARGPQGRGDRRHGGDPYKDTAGPAINPMIKVANIVALLIIPFLDQRAADVRGAVRPAPRDVRAGRGGRGGRERPSASGRTSTSRPP